MHCPPENAARRAALRWCDQATDAAIAWTLFAAPLCFGGRHGFGQLLYAGGVAVGAIATAAGHALRGQATPRRPWLQTVITLAVALPLLQLVPLPDGVIGQLAPALDQLVPAWRSATGFDVHLGEWQTVSVTPWATQAGAALLACHAVLLIVVLRRLRERRDIERLLRAIALAAAAMAALGIAQWLLSNGKLLWVYQHPQRQIGDQVQGAFANKNHFAHFVLLGLAPLAWAALAKLPPPKRRSRPLAPPPEPNRWAPVAWQSALVVSAAAVVMSLSRGAVLAGVVAGLVCVGFVWSQLRLGRNNLGAIAGVTLAVLLAISATDLHRVAQRFGGLAGGGVVESLDGGQARREVWRANVSAAAASPWFGFGAGSHSDVYRAFIRRGFDHEFTHAESGYLQLASETGLAGLTILVGFVALVATACFRALRSTDPRRKLLAAVAAFGLVASAVHSAVDFVWYLPACLSVALMLAACAIRLAELDDRTPQLAPEVGKEQAVLWQSFALPGFAVLALTTLWGPGLAAVSWDHYLLASRHERGLAHAAVADAGDAMAGHEDRVALNEQMIAALDQVLCHQPDNARARLRLAGRLLQAFELSRHESTNAMGLAHLRGAALASEFPTRRATNAWLRQAFGDESRLVIDAHYHVTAALRGAPLQADGYGYLADLTFLSPPSQRNTAALMEQAVRVDPHDGGVLFVAGKHALLAGQVEPALAYWRRAHQAPGRYGLMVHAQLGQRVGAEEYFETFHPGLDVVRAMHLHNSEQKNLEALPLIARYAESLAEATATDETHRLTRAELAEAWWMAGDSWLHCESADRALAALRKAAELSPHNYGIRRTLAKACCEAGHADEAAPHLRWCNAREPGDPMIVELMTRQKRSPNASADQPGGSQRVGHHRGDLTR